MSYKVIATDTYLAAIATWPKEDQDMAAKVQKQLALNPFVGDPLNYRFLREKRIKGRRIYYLVYEDLKLILCVATSQKKDQQTTIDHIKNHLDEFKKTAQDIAKQVS